METHDQQFMLGGGSDLNPLINTNTMEVFEEHVKFIYLYNIKLFVGLMSDLGYTITTS